MERNIGSEAILNLRDNQGSLFTEDTGLNHFEKSNEFCRIGLHEFTRSKKFNHDGFPCCKYCNSDLIDWHQLHKFKPYDFDFKIMELRKEKFRDDWWIKEIDQKAKNHALRKGRLELRNFVRKRIYQSVGIVHDLGSVIKRPYRDGYQTPFSGNIVYYAQHALACCCRKCLEIWHGIPRGRDLYDNEINLLSDLIMQFIDNRLTDLKNEGYHIPATHKQN